MTRPQVKLFHNKEKDMLCGEVVVAGVCGVAQSRAVVPIAKIRRALKRRASMSGVFMTDEMCGKTAVRVAGAQLCGLLATAARAPLQAMRHQAMKQVPKPGDALYARKRAQVYSNFAQSEQFDEIGGWDGLFQLLVRKRQSQMNAAIAAGTPPAQAEADMKRSLMLEVKIMQLVAKAVSDDDDDDDDMSGEEEHESTFGSGRPASNEDRSPVPDYPETRGNGTVDGFSFRKAFRAITQPHTLITDRFRKKRGGGRRAAPEEQEQEQEQEEQPADGGEPQDAAAKPQ